jgi:tetratricopeptide (TPR) repeat protein
MALNPSESPLVDATGRPIKPQDLRSHLDPGVEALIKTELNSAVDQLREWNRSDVQQIKAEVAKHWRWVTGILAALNLVLGVSLVTVLQWVPHYTREQLLAPKVNATVERIITDRSQVYVDKKLKPLNDRVADTNRQLAETAKNVNEKQANLEHEERLLRGQLNVQQLAMNARNGDRKAWEEIYNLAQRNDELSRAAEAAKADVEAFYDIDRAQLSYLVRVDPVSLEKPGYSIDELVVHFLQSNGADRVASVNSIADELKEHPNGPKGAIQVLCEHVQNETNLKVIARITRAIWIVAKTEIRPLDIAGLSTWWDRNKSNSTYRSHYDGLLDALQHSEDPNFDAIAALDRTIEAEPEAVFARALRAEFLMQKGQLDQANDELKEIEKRNADYRWLLLYRAEWYLRKADVNSAIESINKMLQRSPALERFIKEEPVFRSVIDDKRITWPSKRVTS